MIKFSKTLFTRLAKIYVSGIKCSYGNVIKIINSFDMIWTVLTIDSVAENGSFLSFVQSKKLEYVKKHHQNDCVEISLLVPYGLFGDVLKEALYENPENIFILSLKKSSDWSKYLHCSYEKLVAIGTADVLMSVALDENALLIAMNKLLRPPRDIYKKIRALRFE